MSSRFDAEFYSLYRPFYPIETFSGITELLTRRGFHAPFRIADIGCGTGHSTLSLHKTGITAQIIGIDPDSKMLDEARKLAAQTDTIEWKTGSGEMTGLKSKSVDAITIGSAFHWMDPLATKAEFQRILKPGAIIRIFEYQFPKTEKLPELNEWIRREFNLRWKAPNQKPRGSLKELSSGFRHDPAFEWLGEGHPKMQMNLNPEQLTGLILSQSRVLHYEDTLDSEAKDRFRKSLRSIIKDFIKDQNPVFDFKLAWIDLGLSSK